MKAYHSGRLGQRHGICLTTFLGCTLMYATRVGLSVAMVAMTAPSGSSGQENTSTKANSTLPDVCPMDVAEKQHRFNLISGGHSLTMRKYNWSAKTQGILHGSFFYGYLISQIPGSWMSLRIGAKLPIGLSMLIIGILTIVSPFAADGGVAVFFTIRLLLGFLQGVIYPSITVLWSEWAPPSERGRLLSMSYCGVQIGTAFGMFTAGYLADKFGWEAIFYCFGTMCIAWCVPWWFIAYNSPTQHPRISSAERDYIYTALNPDGLNQSKEPRTDKLDVKPPTPWLKIFQTVPIWALLIVEFGHNWGFYTLLTNLPTYLNNILHFSLKSSGALSAMPYLTRFIVMVLSIFLSDWMRGRDLCSPTMLRKAFSITACVGAGVALMGVAFTGCDSSTAVALFAVAVTFTGMVFVGHFLNYSEMAPTYAGILVGMGNTVGTITGIVAPFVVGVLTNGEGGQSVSHWQTVFFISAGMYGFIALVYGIFGSSVRQPWDNYIPVNGA